MNIEYSVDMDMYMKGQPFMWPADVDMYQLWSYY